MLVLTKRAIRDARLTVTAASRTRRAQRSARGRPDPPPDDHYVTVARVRHDDADHDDSLTRAVARVDARDGTVSTSIGSLDRLADPPVPRR
jgi:hypothetical protein